MFKILALREKFAHMSNVSGYDALYKHFPDDIQLESVFGNFKRMYPRGIGRLLMTAAKMAGDSNFYNANSVHTESKLVIKQLSGKYNLVHYSYGEPYYSSFGKIKKNNKAAVAITHHQPVTWWKEHEKSFKKYSNVDAVIALSDYDAAYFNSQMPGKAVCIPHGVDVNFYKPLAVDKKKDDTLRVIFSGRYLRDMATLAAVVKKLSASSLRFHFDIVYLPKKEVWQSYLIELLALPCVTWHSNITGHELLSLYQQADCLLIPLDDCTANNAVLEAMACGLPIVSTDLPAIKTYLDGSISILGRKENADDLCDALIWLHNNEAKRAAMALNARNKAVTEFRWDLIASKTIELFKSL